MMILRLFVIVCSVVAVNIVVVGCAPAPTGAPENSSPATGVSAGPTAEAGSKKTQPTDLQALARRLVTQSAGVKENDIVLVSGA